MPEPILSNPRTEVNPTTPRTPSLSSAERRKHRLVNLGMYAINRGQWRLVRAITRRLSRGGLRHE